MSAGIGFQPIQGRTTDILSTPYSSGNLYFSTDTGKMYLDAIAADGTELNKLAVGGSGAALLYGNQPIVEEDNNGDFAIYLSFLDENVVPQEGDLILNVDGGFYKVIQIEEDYVLCEKIAVSGSGGGGGGSGTGGGSTNGSMIIRSSLSGTVFTLYNQDCILPFTIELRNPAGELVEGNGTGELYINNRLVQRLNVRTGDNSVNIKDYLDVSTTSYTVTITCYMDAGGAEDVTSKKRWNVQATEIVLNWDYDETTINNIDNNIFLSWSISGAATSKTTIITIDNIRTIETNATSYQLDPRSYGLYHGAHQIRMYVKAVLNGTIEVTTDAITKNIIVLDDTSLAPIISCNFLNTKVTQYDTVRIPFIVVDPSAGETTEVVLYEDTIQKDVWSSHPNRTLAYWNYTPTTYGTKNLMIRCGITSVSITLQVERLNIDNAEIEGYDFKFKASDFSSNSAIQAWTATSPSKETITAEFVNFDWDLGGLKTETLDDGSSRQYFRIRTGSKMIISSNIFGKEVTTTAGKCLKVIFRASNCRDYDATVLNCYNTNAQGKNPKGIKIQAQNISYSFVDDTGGGDSQVGQNSCPICEDTYIEYELDISKRDSKKNYIVSWFNGVPALLNLYTDQVSFQREGKLIFGSDDCDVDLYLVKFYERSLTNEEHLQNFIADAPNATEMLARYTRNDILNANNQIDIDKLQEKNPNVRVHLLDVAQAPINKKDSINVYYYAQYLNNKLLLQAENITYKGQGTTSSKYTDSAANLDIDFKNAYNGLGGSISDGDGNPLPDGWSMDDDAIPVKYFNLKVNVASCEGANNAVNQEWYNKFQPYKCRHKQLHPGIEKHDLARDTMQFQPGIVFMKDRNPNTEQRPFNVFKEIPGYVSNPYYRMYAIGCMGNSKKNTDVFHDKTNPKESCIEIAQNNLPQCTLSNSVISDFSEGVMSVYDPKTGATDTAFEFRYPDKCEDQERIDAWMAFLKWCERYDPYPKQGELGDATAAHPNGYVDGAALSLDPENDALDAELVSISGVSWDAATHTVTFSKPLVMNWNDIPKNYDKDGNELPTGLEDSNLKNVTISIFEGDQTSRSFSTDSEEYRLACLLYTCQKHLIMASVIYHYLMVERHALIDNMAKNTFWSTEDGVHWQPIKDYDNDTGDGNDNEGKLSLVYGTEIHDTTPDGEFYFNGNPIVWARLCSQDAIQPAVEEMYQFLDQKGAWDKTAYLKAFEDFQDCIPERIWIEDYYRKYFRPYEVLDSSLYIPMLAGGKKTFQRQQFETYQEKYIDSKYAGHLCNSSTVYFRAYANLFDLPEDVIPGIPVSMYSDCYIQVDLSGATSSKPDTSRKIRAKRNTPYFISLSKRDYSDAPMYIYGANLYQEIGDLTFVKANSFTIEQAVKLRSLTIGTSTGEFTNSRLDNIVLNNNPMLETLIVQGLEKPGPLALTNHPNLKTIDSEYSMFSSITPTDNGELRTFILEHPSSVKLVNLKKLETLKIKSFDSIAALDIQHLKDIPIITKDTVTGDEINVSLKEMVSECLSNGSFERYNLQGIDWTITSPSEVILDGDEPIGLVILDGLLGLTPSNTSHALSLSGKITIAASAYNGNHPEGIYDKYAQQNVYPNIEFVFEGTNAQMYSVKVYDKVDEKVLWYRNITKGQTINKEFLSGGPCGAFDVSRVVHADTAKFTYNFSNQWVYYDNAELSGDGIKYDANSAASEDLIGWPLYNSAVTSDMYLVPTFDFYQRLYHIEFHFPDTTSTISKDKPFNSLVCDCSVMPYKDDSSLGRYRRYGFKGWSLIENGTVDDIIDLSNYRVVTNDLNFYPVFEEENVLEVETDPKYFIFQEFTSGTKVGGTTYYGLRCRAGGSYVEYQLNYMMDLTNPDGIQESLGEVPYCLSGKITIPTSVDGKDVIVLYSDPNDTAKSVSDFCGNLHTEDSNTGSIQKGIKGLFFKSDSKVVRLSNSLFQFNKADSYKSSLKYLEFPSSLIEIGSSAFNGCSKLILKNDTFNLPKLQAIGAAAFSNCNLKIEVNAASQIPTIPFTYSLISIGAHAFHSLTAVSDSDSSTAIAGDENTGVCLVFGTPQDKSLLDTVSLAQDVYGPFSNPPIKSITVYGSISETAAANLGKPAQGYNENAKPVGYGYGNIGTKITVSEVT